VVHTGFWWGNLRERSLARRGIDDKKTGSARSGIGVWTGLVWLKIWTGGVLL